MAMTANSVKFTVINIFGGGASWKVGWYMVVGSVCMFALGS